MLVIVKVFKDALPYTLFVVVLTNNQSKNYVDNKLRNGHDCQKFTLSRIDLCSTSVQIPE